ncbi:phosphatase PAP2 family protein [Blastopirellula sp. JC732]|uniref:Phosphatase PAP2 family protein n=1 Tax=Blastopirellula sediminis TaxID=2894196 RepID=A0A9X1MI44_9BACT|nr:phosphatase PAP2 family protein [Blastopirellula sediminis]MCC9607868.1 phosphatase PAP2 family protein [Blastopirellula sediminis]MCC9627339.1 phosphatase PAP2 family protein [Blastopirellula sediminis]
MGSEPQTHASVTDSPQLAVYHEEPETAPTSLRRVFYLAAALFVLGFLALPIDHPVGANFVAPGEFAWKVKGDLRTLLLLSETFAHGTGVVMIVIALAVLDRQNRQLFYVPLLTALGGGMMANILKVSLLARIRPQAFDFTKSVWDSFYAPFPLFNSAAWSHLGEHNFQGCPSAHSATAAALAVALTTIYPHGKWLFIVLAFLAGCQRVLVGAHFPSDVVWGWAVGALFAAVILDHDRLIRWTSAWTGQVAKIWRGAKRA